MLTLSPMQNNLFNSATRLPTPSKYGNTLTIPSLTHLESSYSKRSYSSNRIPSSYASNMTLSNQGSTSSLSSIGSSSSKLSSDSKSSIKNSYVSTEFDTQRQRIKSTFVEKTIPDNFKQNIPGNQDKLKRKFYDSYGQLNHGVIFNKSYGQNNIETEVYEDTLPPFQYLKITSRNGQMISTTTVRPNQLVQMLKNDQYMPSHSHLN